MKEIEKNKTLNTSAEDESTNKNWWLIITGVVATAIACAVCLVPPAVLLLAGGSLALTGVYIGYGTAALVMVGSILIVGFWYFRIRSR